MASQERELDVTRTESLLSSVEILFCRESDVVGQDTGASAPTWLDGGKKASTVDINQRTAICGEEIGLELDIQNPLMSEIHISRLRASVEASTSSDVQVKDFLYEVCQRASV